MSQLTVNEAGNSTFTDSITIKSGDFAAAVIGTKADDATHTIDYDIPQGAVYKRLLTSSMKHLMTAEAESVLHSPLVMMIQQLVTSVHHSFTLMELKLLMLTMMVLTSPQVEMPTL